MRCLLAQMVGLATGLLVAGSGYAQTLDVLPALPEITVPSITTTPVSGLLVPAYSSRPGATAKLYLDFDGDFTANWSGYSPGTTPAYSTDADTATFSQGELANIYQIWQRVTEAYSPFNVDVTTIDPGQLNNQQAQRVVIGGDGMNGGGSYWPGARAGGIGFVGGFYDGDPNTVFVFPGNLGNGAPKYVAMAAAHESGHGFGLDHQSTYDTQGVETAEYNPGTAERAPLMGVSYFATRGVWDYGTSLGPSIYQDDVAVISGPYNAFGYRPDDHGNTIATATTLTRVGNDLFGSGVIETIADKDFFSFTVGEESVVALQVTGAPHGAMLDPSLALYSLDGSLLELVDTANLMEMLTRTLLAGTYDVSVLSAGLPGDIGQFTLTGTITAVPEPVGLSGLVVMALLLGRRQRRTSGCGLTDFHIGKAYH